MYVGMYACMHAYMYVSMYVCICIMSTQSARRHASRYAKVGAVLKRLVQHSLQSYSPIQSTLRVQRPQIRVFRVSVL